MNFKRNSNLSISREKILNSKLKLNSDSYKTNELINFIKISFSFYCSLNK